MTNIEQVFDNPYVRATLYILIFLYIASIRPSLPPFIKVLFLNPVFRVFILFLIVVRGNNDPIFSLALATAFVLTLTYLGEQKAREAFESVGSDDQDNHGDEDENNSYENGDDQELFDSVGSDDQDNHEDGDENNSYENADDQELFESVGSDDQDNNEGGEETNSYENADEQEL